MSNIHTNAPHMHHTGQRVVKRDGDTAVCVFEDGLEVEVEEL